MQCSGDSADEVAFQNDGATLVTSDVRTADDSADFNFRTFFELSIDLCCIAGTDSMFKQVNSAFERTLGYTAEELTRVSFLDLVHPDDRQATIDEVQKLAEGIDSVRFENRYRCKDGSWKWLSWNCPAALPGSDLLYAIARDITLEKRTAEALRIRDSAFSTMSHGLLITDALQEDDPIVYANPPFVELTGYDESEVLGRNCRFLQNSDTRQPPLNTLRHAVREGRPCRVLLRNYGKDGQLFWNDLSISPVRDNSGVLTHFVGFQSDVTADVEHFHESWNHLSSLIDSLTGRQREVMDGLVAGKSIKQIAMELEISAKTAEMHRARLLERMNVPDVVSLVRLVLMNAPTGYFG